MEDRRVMFHGEGQGMHHREVRGVRAPFIRVLSCAFLFCCLSAAWGESDSAPNAYKGLMPGRSTREDSTRVLGPPPEGMRHGQSDWYPVAIDPNVTDRLDFKGPNGELTVVSAATIDPRYSTREKILARLGEPEAKVLFQTQELLDYSEKGLRFLCDRGGKATGVVYIEAGDRRVPAGYPDTIDLRRPPPETKEPAAPADFLVGTSEIGIAPERFDDVAIEAKRAPYYLEEDVLARVVIFQQGTEKIVLIGLDAFGLTPWDSGSLRKSLAELGFTQVIIASSHTHANVDTLGYFGYYPKAYVQHILRRTRQAVEAAAKNMRPVRVLKMG